MQLNKKHKAFADEYISNGMIAYKAYMSVYKSVKKESTARSSASQLLTKSNVSSYIAMAQAKVAKKAEITLEKSLARQNKISLAFDKLLELGLKETLTTEESSQMSKLLLIVRASDSTRAEEFVSRHLGWSDTTDQSIENKDFTIKIIKNK